MRSNLSRFLAFTVAGVTAFGAFQQDASADRRTSLGGNILIADQDDIYIYPQLTLEHRNLISFDYYPGSALTSVLGQSAQNTTGQGGGGFTPPTNNGDQPVNNGTTEPAPNQIGPRSEDATGVPNGSNAMGASGLLLFGEENFAFGVASHRQDTYGATPYSFLGFGDLQLYGPAGLSTWSILGFGGVLPASTTVPSATPTPNGAASTASGLGGVYLQPLQMADLLFGFGLGETASMGARLSIGQNMFRENRLGAAVEDLESWNTTAVDLIVGLSLRGALYLDLNLELALAFFSNSYTTSETEPDYGDSGVMAPSFSLSGRSLIDLRESVQLGVLGIIHVNSASVDDQFGVSPNSNTNPDSTTFTSANFFLETGAGPVYELPDRTLISAYGTVGFGSSSYSDEGRDFSTNALLLPGFKMSLEHWILDWLAFRTGLSSRYYFAFQSRTFESDAEPNVSASATSYELLWATGVGISLGNFELNGTLTTPFVLAGPQILGGTGPGLFTLLNATYKF